MSGEQYAIATEVAFVQTEDGVVQLGQGDPLPEGVSADEVARLANGGVLEGLDVVDVDETDRLTPTGISETKVRVGDDPDTARAYLDLETAADKPRPALVKHLEGVIAAADSTDAGDLGTEPADG